MSEVSLVIPPLDVVRCFTGQVEPMDQEVISLQQGNRQLAALRDLLLPKLVTGAIDVSSLDLDALVGAVENEA